MRPRPVWILVGVLGTLGSCSFWEKDWREVTVGNVPLEDAWTAMVEIAEVDGYPIDPGGTDRGKHVLETRWRTRAGPFRGSVRKRVHAEFERTRDDTAWMVRYYVERQNVPDVSKGFDPAEEDWAHDGQDQETEDRIAAKLRFRFEMPQFAPKPLPRAPGSEFRDPDGRPR